MFNKASFVSTEELLNHVSASHTASPIYADCRHTKQAIQKVALILWVTDIYDLHIIINSNNGQQ